MSTNRVLPCCRLSKQELKSSDARVLPFKKVDSTKVCRLVSNATSSNVLGLSRKRSFSSPMAPSELSRMAKKYLHRTQ